MYIYIYIHIILYIFIYIYIHLYIFIYIYIYLQYLRKLELVLREQQQVLRTSTLANTIKRSELLDLCLFVRSDMYYYNVPPNFMTPRNVTGVYNDGLNNDVFSPKSSN